MADAVREAGHVLLALIDTRTERYRVVDVVESIDLRALIDVARAHRVTALVHRRLVDAGVDLPPSVATGLQRERISSAALQLTSYRTIAAIAGRSSHLSWS